MFDTRSMQTEAGLQCESIGQFFHLTHLMTLLDSQLIHLPGVTLVKNATRAKPNAFHFRRQILILQRAGAGSAESQFKENSFYLICY